MFYFRVGSGWYSALNTWDGDGCGVTYTVRTRLWCGIWPAVEVKPEKRQQYNSILPKSGIVPHVLRFILVVITYRIQPNLVQEIPT